MSALPLVRLEIWSDFQCAGGTRLAILPLADCLECLVTRRLTGEHEARVVVPTDATAAPELTVGRVLRAAFSAEANTALFEEHRIWQVIDTGVGGSSTKEVIGRGPLNDLRNGDILTTTSGTTVTLGASFEGSPFAIVDALLAYLPSWWNRGVMLSADPVEVSGSTVLEVLQALAATLGLELRATPTPSFETISYDIELVDDSYSSGVTADIRTGKNLLATRRIVDLVDGCTAVFPTCAGGETIAAAQWKISAIAGNDVSLVDPYTGDPPQQYNNQFDGKYLKTDASPATYREITLTAAGYFTMASVTDLAVGELVQIVADASGTDLVILTHPTATPTRIGKLETGFKAVANYCPNPLADQWTGGVPDSVIQWSPSAADPTFVEETTLVQHGFSSIKWASSDTASNKNGLVFVHGYHFPGTRTFRVRANVYTSGGVARSVFVAITDATGANIAAFGTVETTSSVAGWREVEVSVTGNPTTNPVCVRIACAGNAAFDCVVDAVLLTVDEALPNTFYAGFGRNKAWLAGLDHLFFRSSPPPRYDFTFADLAAWSPTDFSYDVIDIGWSVRVRDTDLDITVTPRVIEIARDYKNPLQSRLVLASEADTVSARLAA